MKMSVRDHLDLLNTWDFSKNTTDPSEIPVWSKEKFWWKCAEGIDHEWCTSPTSRVSSLNCANLEITNHISKCPFCCNKRVSVTNSLSAKFPEISEEWHPTKNGELTPDKVVYGHGAIVWWQCKRNNHEFKDKVIYRTNRGYKCPQCIPMGESLAETHPTIAAEWDHSKNKLKPKDVYTCSNKKYWWLCSICGSSWHAQAQNRTNRGDTCPKCKSYHHSKPERYIRFELNQFLMIAPEGTKIEVENKNYDVDIIIPNLRLIIEYDGSYFHKDRVEIDKNKTQVLITNGWNVIRVRESNKQVIPCKITDNDILMYSGTPLKQVIDKLLIAIEATYNVNLNIENYLKQTALQNKNLADAYIIEQMIIEREIVDLRRNNSNERSRVAEIKNRIIHLAIEESLIIREIITKIKEEYAIDLSKEIISNILKQSGKKRKGIRWLEPELRHKIENKVLDLLNKQHTLLEIADKIKKEFEIAISISLLSKISNPTSGYLSYL